MKLFKWLYKFLKRNKELTEKDYKVLYGSHLTYEYNFDCYYDEKLNNFFNSDFACLGTEGYRVFFINHKYILKIWTANLWYGFLSSATFYTFTKKQMDEMVEDKSLYYCDYNPNIKKENFFQVSARFKTSLMIKNIVLHEYKESSLNAEYKEHDLKPTFFNYHKYFKNKVNIKDFDI